MNKCDKCEVGNPCLYCKHEFEVHEKEVSYMSENYLVTDQYCELEYKARLFADVFDYDSAIAQGIFQFYNSPSFRSFSFTVNPSDFHEDASRYLYKQFMERLNNYDK